MAKFRLARLQGWLDDWVADLGPSPKIQLRSGPEEASTSATATGTIICRLTMASTPFPAANASAQLVLAAPITGNATDVGVIGHARLMDNAESTCHWVGSVSAAVAYALTADAAIGATVLTVADTSAIVLGSGVVGGGVAGVQDGTVVAAKTSTTITISKPLTAALPSTTAIVVGDISGDLVISGAYVANVGDPVSLIAWVYGFPDLF